MKHWLTFFALVFGLYGCTVKTPKGTSDVYVPDEQEQTAWEELRTKGIDKIVFVKRFTYNSNHYYTEYLNSKWMPGGNLCTLSLATGEVTDLVPSLAGGVFGSFDLSFDAQRIVFAYKAGKYKGYRLYEVGVDGSGLRQLTFDPEDEQTLFAKYKLDDCYRGTEDLDPCYLPDGGIAFISTRCHYSTLCDGPDIFTTTVMYRIDSDGSHMKKLSNGSVSEHTPTVLPDGRILYTRWEYVDKGAVAVKCLWAMNPDGSNSSEVYGNDIAFPTTMIMARPIPGSNSEYVFTGTPHYPQNGVGTIVRVDVSKDIRTRDAMTYMTPHVDIQEESGFVFSDPKDRSRWIADYEGKGPLFRESYPLSRSKFIVSHKPTGPVWHDSTSYQLYLLEEGGKVFPVYSADSISCFHPMPLEPRVKPPILPTIRDSALAGKQLAKCIVTDVYDGMKDVEKGSVRYLRILEQVPRPWGARRFYKNIFDDEYDQQHAVITKDTHLGLKVQHGIVTVEADGSAYFLVPAERNIIIQALDSNFMALQTERTFVNYMPGEVRSCVGCHETNVSAPQNRQSAIPLALKREAEIPYAQPGETAPSRTLSYVRDVQPVWDKHCVRCHYAPDSPGRLNLSGKLTCLFNESYESLVPERRKFIYDRGVLGPVIGENHPKTGNIHYLPPRSLGSHASILVAMLYKGKVTLKDPGAQRKALWLVERHKHINLSKEELLRVTNWVDTNCQYYGSYYGRRNIKYRDHPDFRTEYCVEDALRKEAPVSYKD